MPLKYRLARVTTFRQSDYFCSVIITPIHLCMALLNEYFLELPSDDLFSDVAKKINIFKVLRPYAELIDLGIYDVTSPLPSSIVEAMHKAVDDMADSTRFHGYGPEQGYEFLRDSIIKNDFN